MAGTLVDKRIGLEAMDPRQLVGVDKRLLGRCAYCGAAPDTRDHVPSRILLDDPVPDNIPVVEACTACNGSFSLDEEYFACFVECVIAGSTDPDRLRREKVKHALRRNARLAVRIQASTRTDDSGMLIWVPENDRVRNVILKLARGHAAYELGLTHLDEPDNVSISPFLLMSETEREDFEKAGAGELRPWPEIGSRAFMRACGAKPYEDQCGPWLVIQPDRYRYAVDQYRGMRVQVCLSEYLGCIVDWS